jgi:hypothetical protein
LEQSIGLKFSVRRENRYGIERQRAQQRIAELLAEPGEPYVSEAQDADLLRIEQSGN